MVLSYDWLNREKFKAYNFNIIIYIFNTHVYKLVYHKKYFSFKSPLKIKMRLYLRLQRKLQYIFKSTNYIVFTTYVKIKKNLKVKGKL